MSLETVKHFNVSLKGFASSFLDRYQLSAFYHRRLFPDGGQFVVSDIPDWVQHYYSNRLYLHDRLNGHMNHCQDAFLLWSDWPDYHKNRAIRDMRDYYGLDYGLNIVQKSEQYCDIFGFISYVNNPTSSYLYRHYPHIFLSHIRQYQEQCASLVRAAASQRFFLNHNAVLAQNESQDTFANNISQYSQQKALITPKELSCLYALSLGHSAKGVAEQLNISSRTVEKHIAHLKEKLQCNTLFELGMKMEHLLS